MKVFQTIHKYHPHIPWFEEKYGVSDSSNHSFADLQKLIIEDGYASSYILLPALEGKTDEVFFTIWNYERMQVQWAKEHGMQTTNLQAIKQAQINWFKPDVFYDFSAMLDKDFLEKYPIDASIKKIAWYAIIQPEPEFLPNYDCRLTLHKPFLNVWEHQQLKAFELQPAFDYRWEKYELAKKDIDILFYGQFLNGIFRNRNKFVTDLLKFSELHTNLNIKVHLTLQSTRMVRKRILGFGIPKWHEKFPSDFITQHALPPIYGDQLYRTIGASKFVINGYGNYNQHFKSNMRLFESIGCGSLLISEKGNYPDGFMENKHYFSYEVERSQKLFATLDSLVINYEDHKQFMQPFHQEIKKMYAKQHQWELFKKYVALL